MSRVLLQRLFRFLRDCACLGRIANVGAYSLKPEQLRIVVKQRGFSVKRLAVEVGLDVRTLERRFREQFRTTPKAWIMHERMSLAPGLLAEGLSNKEVAASLSYSCESNFCRDFKRQFGCAPQKFAQMQKFSSRVSCFDKGLSCFGKSARLLQ